MLYEAELWELRALPVLGAGNNLVLSRVAEKCLKQTPLFGGSGRYCSSSELLGAEMSGCRETALAAGACWCLLLDVCKGSEGFPAPFWPSPKVPAAESHPAFRAPALRERCLGAGTNCRLAEGVVFCGGDLIISHFAFRTKVLAGLVPRCRISTGRGFSPWLGCCRSFWSVF